MKPMAWFHKIVRFSQKINDPRFLRLFFALEKWSLDGHDIPSSWYKFVIDELYQKNAILNQSVFEDRIKLKIENLNFPIFEFYSVDDHIVPDGSGVPWLWKKQGLTVKTMPVKGGHVGSLISDYSKKNYWPQMTKWLMEQSA
jgi:poly(3-hydroxyalkanoate) synthetase